MMIIISSRIYPWYWCPRISRRPGLLGVRWLHIYLALGPDIVFA